MVNVHSVKQGGYTCCLFQVRAAIFEEMNGIAPRKPYGYDNQAISAYWCFCCIIIAANGRLMVWNINLYVCEYYMITSINHYDDWCDTPGRFIVGTRNLTKNPTIMWINLSKWQSSSNQDNCRVECSQSVLVLSD